MTAPRWHADPISEGRKNFIRNLLAEREVPQADRDEIFRQAQAGMNTGQAIHWIETLKGYGRKGGQERRSDTITVTEEGFYLGLDNEAYKVQRTKDKERLYAKRATPNDWEYDKGAIYRLTPEMIMSAHQIAEFGRNRGFCVVCSTEFQRYISTQLGIGPTCGPKTMGKDAYNAAKAELIASDPKAAEEEAMLKAQAKARREADKAQAAELAAQDARIAALQEGSPVDQAELHTHLPKEVA
jgi:hypothetical protein